MKNSTNTNLLILDEVFDSSLDANGTEEFLKILNTMDKGINAFVISHKVTHCLTSLQTHCDLRNQITIQE